MSTIADVLRVMQSGHTMFEISDPPEEFLDRVVALELLLVDTIASEKNLTIGAVLGLSPSIELDTGAQQCLEQLEHMFTLHVAMCPR